jgi:hypothetical protein
MLPFITAAIAAVAGAITARRRNGNGFDMAQWAAVWALIGGLGGLLALILLARAA